MRRGDRNGWIEGSGRFVGINLGADFCAEHECGIGPLKGILGIDGATSMYSRERPVYKEPPGLPRLKITKHDAVKLYEAGDFAALVCTVPWIHENIAKVGIPKGLSSELRIREDKKLATAWSENDFGICGYGADAERIKELAKAFEADNVAVWLGGRILLENAGLVICIVDRVPEEAARKLRESHEDADKLRKASDATGIIERLERAGRRYYACVPRWKSEDQKSAYPVVYFLNPMEQHENNYGWFTVEALDAWIEGKGPIPAKRKGNAL